MSLYYETDIYLNCKLNHGLVLFMLLFQNVKRIMSLSTMKLTSIFFSRLNNDYSLCRSRVIRKWVKFQCLYSYSLLVKCYGLMVIRCVDGYSINNIFINRLGFSKVSLSVLGNEILKRSSPDRMEGWLVSERMWEREQWSGVRFEFNVLLGQGVVNREPSSRRLDFPWLQVG